MFFRYRLLSLLVKPLLVFFLTLQVLIKSVLSNHLSIDWFNIEFFSVIQLFTIVHGEEKVNYMNKITEIYYYHINYYFAI